MRIKPTVWIGVLVYVLYCVVIFTTWYLNDVNYLEMVHSDVILKSIVVPLALGAIFMTIAKMVMVICLYYLFRFHSGSEKQDGF